MATVPPSATSLARRSGADSGRGSITVRLEEFVPSAYTMPVSMSPASNPAGRAAEPGTASITAAWPFA